MIEFKCVRCKQEFSVADSLSGTIHECWACGLPCRVPVEGETPPEEEELTGAPEPMRPRDFPEYLTLALLAALIILMGILVAAHGLFTLDRSVVSGGFEIGYGIAICFCGFVGLALRDIAINSKKRHD